MTDPIRKTPWNARMSPEEMRDYYEQKSERLKRECWRDGCDATVEFPRRYCSSGCKRYTMRKALAELFDEPEPTEPEAVPQRTPEDMQDVIDHFKSNDA